MNEALQAALKGKVVIDLGDETRWTIDALYEVRDGTAGPDTAVVMAKADGELSMVLLETLRDPDCYRIYRDAASADRAGEAQKQAA